MYKSIGMPEFYQKAKREQLPIIDVREKDEYAHGHVPGARNIPLSNLGNDYPQLDQDKHYYTYLPNRFPFSDGCAVSSKPRLRCYKRNGWYRKLARHIRINRGD